MRKIALTFVAGIMMLSLNAQKTNRALKYGLKDGDRYFAAGYYADAADVYNELVFKYPDNLEANQKAARAYVLAEDHVNAEVAYAALTKLPNTPAESNYFYGLELLANGKYKEAQDAFDVFVKANPNDPRAQEFAGSYDKITALLNDSKSVTIENYKFNSASSDIAPVFYKDGILFSSKRYRNNAIVNVDEPANSPFYNLFISGGDSTGKTVEAKKWKAKNIDKQLHDGVVSFSADGKEIYFTGSNRSAGKAKLGKKKEINLKVYHAVYDSAKQQWTDVRPLPFCSNEYSVAHPSLSADGKRLFFVSNMPGGYGETDVYVSFRDGATWGTPINLGRNINTSGRELFPYIATNNTLYFTSDNRVGLGGLDIYSATFNEGAWGNSKNLGVPFNSQYDDFGYIVNDASRSGYFVSNRSGGKGSDDIYSFGGILPVAKEAKVVELTKLKETFKPVLLDSSATRKLIKMQKVEEPKVEVAVPKVEVKTTVDSPKVNVPLPVVEQPKTMVDTPKIYTLSVEVQGKPQKEVVEGAVVTLYNPKTGELQKKVITDKLLNPTFLVRTEERYELCVTHVPLNENGSFNYPCKSISTNTVSANFAESIELAYIEKDAVIKEDVHFDLDKAIIKPEEEVWLKRVAGFMEQLPKLKLEITSHTDCLGAAAYNEKLSQQRLESIMNWFRNHNVDVSRIMAIAYGERKPSVNCACEACTDEDNKANRRVEIRVLEVN